MKIAVYPGSFDPPTLGHLDVMFRAEKFFDKLYILVGKSYDKNPLFDFEERIEMLKSCLETTEPKFEVVSWSGLTIDFMKKYEVDCIVRGVRSSVDFRAEQTIANVNSELYESCETMLFCCRPEFRDLSSRIVKEVASHSGDISKFVTPLVEKKIKEKILKLKASSKEK